MRNFALFCLVICTTSCTTTTKSVTSSEVLPEEFVRVIEIEGVSKNDLYVRANQWFVESFNSAESVIEFQDKESGKISGKYFFDYQLGTIYYRGRQVISLDVRDGAARFKVSNPAKRYKGSVMGSNAMVSKKFSECRQKDLVKFHEQWNALSDLLAEALNTSDDW